MSGPVPRSPLDRFHESYSVGSSCWEWKSSFTTYGYGVFSHGPRGSIKVLAHRMAVMLQGRNLASADHVRHSCDNPPCVNPSHLTVGTHGQNMADMVAKGRSPWGERHGSHILTASDVVSARSRCASGESRRDLAREFGVSKATITDAISGRTWGRLVRAEDGAK